MNWLEVVLNVSGSILIALIIGSILIRIEWDEGDL